MLRRKKKRAIALRGTNHRQQVKSSGIAETSSRQASQSSIYGCNNAAPSLWTYVRWSVADPEGASLVDVAADQKQNTLVPRVTIGLLSLL